MRRLEDTVKMMNSDNYEDRFIAEYYQVVIRKVGLENMLEKWDEGTLGFEPKSDRFLLDWQLKTMISYIGCLEARAEIEGIEL